MNIFLIHSTPSNLNPSNLSFSLKSKHSTPNLLKTKSLTIAATIPARDRVIDFGKHKGKMLGTLPSIYLKWVSKNLRARDFEEWAKLADQVLEDPIYKDRLEWEYADKVLNGDDSSSRSESPVRDLLEMSERFGWDNEDKVGWSKVNFQLLGTSKGGRIPRVLDGNGGGRRGRDFKLKRDKARVLKGDEAGMRERREERRERVKIKRGVETKEKLGSRRNEESRFGNGDVVGNGAVEPMFQENQRVEIYNPFPGRESLLKKVLNRRRVL